MKAVVSDGLVKPPQTPCPHCTGSGCAIYARRPRVCAGYQCGWRFLPWVPEALRPDRSGVMVDPIREAPPGYRHAVSILALGPLEVLRSDAVRSVIGLLVEQEVAVYIAKPNGPGELLDLVLTNGALARAVADRDDDALSKALEHVCRILAASARADAGFTPDRGPAQPPA